MRNKIQLTLFILPFLLVAQLVTAQVGFGPRAGLNISSAEGKQNSSTFRVGYHVGAYAKIALMEQLDFQPELLYSLKGYGTNTGYGYNSTQRLFYLDVPLLLNYGTPQGVRLLAGLQPSVLLAAKYRNKGNTVTKGDNKDQFRTMDLGVVCGVGYQSENGFNADFRFGYGLWPIFSDKSPNRLHMLNFQLTAGYTIGK